MQVLKLKNLFEELEEKFEAAQKDNKRLQGNCDSVVSWALKLLHRNSTSTSGNQLGAIDGTDLPPYQLAFHIVNTGLPLPTRCYPS